MDTSLQNPGLQLASATGKSGGCGDGDDERHGCSLHDISSTAGGAWHRESRSANADRAFSPESTAFFRHGECLRVTSACPHGR